MGQLYVVKYLHVEINMMILPLLCSPRVSLVTKKVLVVQSEKFVNVVYRAVCGRKFGNSSSMGGAVNFKVPRL